MQAKTYRRHNSVCATLSTKTQNTAQDTGALEHNNNSAFPAMHRLPTQLPDPWLFDSEKLLLELDRCRELVLRIPAPTHETHFALNIAVDSIWNLRETLRHLLHLHRDGQRAFAKQQVVAQGKHQQRASAKLTKSSIVRLKA
jgi:hypothetical protein